MMSAYFGDCKMPAQPAFSSTGVIIVPLPKALATMRQKAASNACGFYTNPRANMNEVTIVPHM
jgi:hypothetical protein